MSVGRRNHRDRAQPQRRKTVLRARGEQGRRSGPAAESFRCAHCRLDVPLRALGTAHRNHCPHCLTSLHVDGRVPGDRAADCHGRMEAASVSARPDGEWLIIHRCLSCGELSANRVAGDDNARALVRLAVRPLSATTARRALMLL
ncbi:RNHCP domain-containing protein [Nocardiopsis exhalans]|uniref:RNHCP domain-containing protein n=1 Tax=Nocardiopsis exhalans TaxID=163604 RepID=A0ABY5DBD1_9ACTN|nr:RNHCP domain-containing protein [Nocardiopsis exhalans]USY21270.1 RNHCP domain-containing protein [Nocardiopsis exhalans]